MQASGLTLRRFWTVFFAILLGPVEQVLWKPVSTIRARGLLRPRWRLHVLPGAERHVLHCVATLRRDLRGESYNTIYLSIYIYIYGTPPPCTHACLLNLGFGKGWVLGMPLFPAFLRNLSCRTAWVNGIGGVPVDIMFVPYLEVQNSRRGPR